MNNKTLDIVIPVYNEGENILKTFEEITKKIKTPNRILVVYDFDEDNTLPPARKALEEYPNIVLVKNIYGRGALNAIKTGFVKAENEYVLVAMADLSDDLIVVDAMVEKMDQGSDIVCGSRYIEGGKQIGGPWLKKTMSRMAGLSLKWFTGIPTHDVTNSFKLYRKKVLDQIEIESDGGFELGMEIVVKSFQKGYHITEVPSVWTDRSAGQSNFKLWKWLPKYLKWYLKAYFKPKV